MSPRPICSNADHSPPAGDLSPSDDKSKAAGHTLLNLLVCSFHEVARHLCLEKASWPMRAGDLPLGESVRKA